MAGYSYWDDIDGLVVVHLPTKLLDHQIKAAVLPWAVAVFLKFLLTQLRVGFFRCTSEGCVLELNDALLELLGFLSDDVAEGMELVDLVPSGERVRSMLQQARDADRPQKSARKRSKSTARA